MPGAPFQSFGTRLQQIAREEITPVVLACTDGYLGYLVDRTASENGWYEAQISRFDERSLEAVFDSSAALIESLGGRA